MRARQAAALVLIGLVACSTTPHRPFETSDDAERELHALRYDLHLATVGAPRTQPVKLDAESFARALRAVARDVRTPTSPRQTAQWLMAGGLQANLLAEVDRGQVVRLMPMEDGTPLTSASAAQLRRDYTQWCAKAYGGGDCLGLLTDGPYLQREDLRLWALAIALGGVLGETRHALQAMVSPQALLSLVLFTTGFYLALWLLPEPVSKALAASLTLALTAWLSVDTLWSLMDGWARLTWEADRATSFEGLREAGEKYGKVMGEDTARVLVMLVTAALAGSGAKLAQRLPKLPGYEQAAAQAEAQVGVRLASAGEVESAAVEAEGTLAFMVRRPGSQGAVAAAETEGVITLIRHQGGNRQVLLRGQRWHVPANRSVNEIPAHDPVGDQLQDAAQRIARNWSRSDLTRQEERAIEYARRSGQHFKAHLMERQFRGKYIEKQLRDLFVQLRWSRTGVDVADPSTGYRYEILSGTVSNMELHGRRMAEDFFRLITF